MKIISEITGKTYPSVEACLAAEKEFTEQQNRLRKAKEDAAKKEKAEREAKEKARGERAKEVEKAYKIAMSVREDCQKRIEEADANYQKLLNEFLKDYKQFHFTVESKGNSLFPSLLFDLNPFLLLP